MNICHLCGKNDGGIVVVCVECARLIFFRIIEEQPDVVQNKISLLISQLRFSELYAFPEINKGEFED